MKDSVRAGKIIGTVSMHPRKNAKEKWFNASADQNHVLIQKAERSHKEFKHYYALLDSPNGISNNCRTL